MNTFYEKNFKTFNIKQPKTIDFASLEKWEMYQLIDDLQTNPLVDRSKEVRLSNSRWHDIFYAQFDAKNYDIYADIEEGVLECKYCHSKNALYYSKQVRASDKPETIFALCGNCKTNLSIAT